MNRDASEASRDRRINEVIAAYLEARRTGAPANRQEWLGRHPDLADELQSFFADQDNFERLAGPPGPPEALAAQAVAEAATLAPGPTEGFAPGVRVRYFGDYELLEEIARGGMGVVFKARQLSLNRTVALKMILAGQLASAEDVHRFRTEAEAAGNLDHPNILPIHEVGEHQGQHFFSMKLIEGGSLTQYLPRLTGDPRAAARLLATVARAVHFAHQRGILHRDLKPANILLDNEGQPYVTDFGLAKRVLADSQLTQSGVIVGTPSYMAPEQAAARKDLSTAADVYSLGAILYELLAGRPPFRAATPLDTILQVLDREPERPRASNPRLSRDLETVCLKCLEKDPARRYESAAALADDLERWLAGRPVSARPVGQFGRTWRWCRRNPAVATLTAAVAAALLAGTVVSTSFALHANRKAEDELVARQGEQYQRLEAERQREAAERQREEARRSLYVANMSLAQRAWVEGMFTQALDLLNAYQPHSGEEDLRGFEWYLLERVCHPELHTLTGHTDYVKSVTFSSDGKWLASGSDDGTVRLWDTATGKELRSLWSYSKGISGVALSPDGKALAGAAADGAVKVWDPSTGRELHFFAPPDPERPVRGSLVGIAFSPDGKRLAWGSPSGAVWLWDATRTQGPVCVGRSHEGAVCNVAWSHDGKWLATGSFDGTAKIWDAVKYMERHTLPGFTGGVRTVAFSPDGKYLAVGGIDLTEKLYDPASGKELLKVQHPNVVGGVAFSSDGRLRAVACGNGTVRIMEGARDRELATFRGHAMAATGVAFSPDGKWVASCSEDTTLKLWVTAGAPDMRMLGEQGTAVYTVAFGPDGRRLATGVDDGVVKVWDMGTAQLLWSCAGHTSAVRGVVFSPDGKCVASAGSDQAVKMWDAVTGRQLWAQIGHAQVILGVAFSPDGRTLATASGDSTVKLWDANTGREVRTLKGHTDYVNGVAFSPNGRWLATASGDETAKVWDVETGREFRTLTGHKNLVMGVCFSPDSKRLATSSYDTTVREWDTRTGRPLRTLRGHSQTVASVAYSPDGKRLASAGWDGVIEIWDTDSGRSVGGLGNGALRWSAHQVAFSPDGWWLAWAGQQGFATVLDARPLTPALQAEREALAVAAHLFDKPLTRDEVVAAVRADQTLTAAVRDATLSWAARWQEEPRPFDTAAWAVVSQPNESEARYRQALRWAETACRLSPEHTGYLTNLAVAQYRTGHYKEALGTLARVTAKGEGDYPANLSVQAMAHHRLGHRQEARDALARLRDKIRMLDPPEAEIEAWLREAEGLLGEAPKQKK